jgi:hypothetical protein
LIQRLNRVLAKENKQIRTTRGGQDPELGDYFIVDFAKNVVYKNVDLEGLGRKLGVLRQWGAVAE